LHHGAAIVTYLESLVRDYGAPAVTIILTLESLGLPLPGESLLIFASVMAARGDISFTTLMICAWLAAVMGDNIGYLIGHFVGRPALVRYGARIGLTAQRIAKVENVFHRYGPVTVAFARFFNVLRQLNGVVAGMMGMDWRKFVLFNALGGALWVGVWGGGAYYFSGYIGQIAQFAEQVGLAGGILVAVLVIGGLITWWVRSRQAAGGAQSPPPV